LTLKKKSVFVLMCSNSHPNERSFDNLQRLKTGFTENQALVVWVMFSNIWQMIKMKKLGKLKQAIKSAWQQKSKKANLQIWVREREQPV